jgi:DNA polymerase III psi subunit
MKTFHDEYKLKLFRTTKSSLQKILKSILHTEEEENIHNYGSSEKKKNLYKINKWELGKNQSLTQQTSKVKKEEIST